MCADISVSKKIEEVYKDVPNVSFIESNIMDMNNIEDGRFDAVKFDRVFQYSPKSLRKLFAEEMKDIANLDRMEDIGTGEHMLFLGRKLPSWILPCSVTFYLVRKRDAWHERNNTGSYFCRRAW